MPPGYTERTWDPLNGAKEIFRSTISRKLLPHSKSVPATSCGVNGDEASRRRRVAKEAFPAIRDYQKLAMKHGIPDIFQDNGGKILQVCLILGLRVLESREGNDAIDGEGNEYELKTVNLLRTNQFTTHHHLNPVIIEKYRKVSWIFATYEAIELKEIFLLRPQAMEHWYARWSDKWMADGNKDINNPKVPLSYVRQHGQQLYSSVGENIEDALPKPSSKIRSPRSRKKR